MTVSLETVEEAVELANGYFAELLEYDRLAALEGECAQYTKKLTCLNRLIRALSWDVQGGYNTDNTQILYALLLTQISTYHGAVPPVDPNVVIPGTTVIVPPGDILQTSLVFPGEGETSYTFTDLIGNTVLTVYRGTGTTLRAHSGAPDNEYAQFDSITGTITITSDNPFNAGESLWVEYKTLT